VDKHLHGVIMAGGRGTRFWPLSTRARPKQLLSIAGRRTMIQETFDRLEPLVPPSRLWVVTGAGEAGEVARQLPKLDPAQLLVEPVGRNTAAAIALAARQVAARDPRAVMAVLPADHAIADPAAFRAALGAAARAAAEHPVLVTLGIAPARPETGYGYIERGGVTLRAGGHTFYSVARFREKPDRATAERYLAGGEHHWNAGVFVWRVETILEEIATHLPELARELGASGITSPERAEAAAAVAHAYGRIEGISIDYGVLERSTRTWVLPVDCGWNDVGSWSALFDIRSPDAEGNVLAGDVLAIDARDSLVEGVEGTLVALVGVRDLVVIAARGAFLVCARDHAQDVRRVVEELERRGRDDLL
jgi:mannose-1-phosphate guanylyltransferase